MRTRYTISFVLSALCGAGVATSVSVLAPQAPALLVWAVAGCIYIFCAVYMWCVGTPARSVMVLTGAYYVGVHIARGYILSGVATQTIYAILGVACVAFYIAIHGGKSYDTGAGDE